MNLYDPVLDLTGEIGSNWGPNRQAATDGERALLRRAAGRR